MAQRYGKHPNGRYWHVNTVIDMIELQANYDIVPNDLKKGGRYHNQLMSVEESIEYLEKVHGVADAKGLLNDERLKGLFEYCHYDFDNISNLELIFLEYWEGEENQ